MISKKAFQLANKDELLIGRIHSAQGYLVGTQWNLEKGKTFWIKALELHERAGDRIAESKTLFRLGVAEHWAGRISTARIYYERCLSIARRIGDRNSTFDALCALATLHQGNHAIDLAREYLHAALSIAQQLEHRSKEALALELQGIVELRIFNYEDADIYFRESLSKYKKSGLLRREVEIHSLLALMHREMGDLHQAFQHYFQALAIISQVKEPRAQAMVESGIAAIYFAKGNIDEGNLWFARSKENASKIDEPSLLQILAIHEGHRYLAEGDREKAKQKASVDPKCLGLPDVFFPHRILQTELKESKEKRTSSLSGDGIWISQNGMKIKMFGGKTIDLSRRAPARRIFLRLLLDVHDAPGRGISRHVLFEAGWPAQEISETSASRRVYGAISTLRKLGLRNQILNSGDGYFLDPNVSWNVQET